MRSKPTTQQLLLSAKEELDLAQNRASIALPNNEESLRYSTLFSLSLERETNPPIRTTHAVIMPQTVGFTAGSWHEGRSGTSQQQSPRSFVTFHGTHTVHIEKKQVK